MRKSLSCPILRPMPSTTSRILIADDQRDVREALRLLLKGEGCHTEMVDSPAQALAALETQDFDLLLMDLNYARDTTSGSEGLDLLAKVQAAHPALPIVVMTAWGTVDLAVETMRRGARDFIQKPWDNDRVLATIRTQLALGQALRQGRKLEAENQLLREQGRTRIVTESKPMRDILQVIQRVAPSDANVLITGENGTGKGVVAQLIHEASPRASKSMLTVNTGGFPEHLIESELFGHVRGAFTDAKSDRIGRFELADGGTLFLDEIANVPLAHQARLLRVLETGEFERVGSSRTRRANVRILAATNADLMVEAAAGRFRQDLLFRLNTIQIHLPPLRERREDIPMLAQQFLQQLIQRYRKPIEGLDEQALERLLRHPWPGNVRELRHAMERGVLMAAGPRIGPDDLGLGLGKSDGAKAWEEMSLEEVEGLLIQKALARHEGNVSKAAEALGLSRSAFYRRLEKYRL